MRVPTKATCPECGRTFDLLIEAEANDWFYGHDCDPDYEPEKLTEPITVTASASLVDTLNGPRWRYKVAVNGCDLTIGAAVYHSEQEALTESIGSQNAYREVHGLPLLADE
jgi:hypothetical protein